MSSAGSSFHQEGPTEYVPYHQFGVRGGGRFSLSNPKSDVDWKIYRARQVSPLSPPSTPPSVALCPIMETVCPDTLAGPT